MPRKDKHTTKPGYLNRKGQIVVRDTGEPGTDHNARKFELRCTHCGHHYGANSTDIWQRKCPKCQGGREGLPLGTGDQRRRRVAKLAQRVSAGKG